MKTTISLAFISAVMTATTVLGQATGAPGSGTAKFSHDTDWMAGKIGIFQHRLYGECPDALETMKKVDPKAMAAQLADIGADYFCITLNQCAGSFLAPNDVYEGFRQSPRGTVCNTRDIPMELADALAEKGIRLMLYSTGTPPRGDEKGVRAIGYDYKGDKADPLYTTRGVKNWAQVFQFWSKRYGTKICGWWIDGCYKSIGFDMYGNNASEIFCNALKSGNPHAVVSFNSGIGLQPHSPFEDYLAGEINEPFFEACSGRWMNGRQWHLLTYTYSPLGFPQDVRYTDAEWIAWLKPTLLNGAAVTIDGFSFDTGCLKPAPAQQLKRVIAAVRGRLDPNGPEMKRITAIDAVRQRTDLIEADFINVEFGKNKFFKRGYAFEDSTPDRKLVRKAADGTEIWSDAIQAALDKNGGVRLPPRPKPYVIDRPIVLKSGQSIWGGVDIFTLKSSHRCIIRATPAMKGPMITNSGEGDAKIFVKGLFFDNAENPAEFTGVKGLIVRDMALFGCRGTGVAVNACEDFRIDGVRAMPAIDANNRSNLARGVVTDAECKRGLVRNVSRETDKFELTVIQGSDIWSE